MRISSARTKALRTGLSFVLTFAMTVGSIPTDGIAYASITNGAKTPQVETKVETTADTAATTPVNAGVAADTTNVSIDVTADEPKTVKVRFDADGGEGHMDDFEVTLDGGDWSVADAPFTRDGYRFVGWSIASDVDRDAVDDPETDIDESLTGVVLADKQEFVDLVSQKRDEDGNVVETHDFGKYVSDDVLTLYAQWEKVVTTSEPVVEENEVAKTEENVDEAVGDDEVVEGTSVGKDDSIDATSDKELDRELLSGAFGNKTDGGVADKVGTSSPLSRKLMVPLMAAAVPSLTTQSTPGGSREGTAYAVLEDDGTLMLFRSTNTYSAGTGQTVTDVMGNTYTGQVYTGIENTGTRSTSAPWYSIRTSVTLARIADGQVIMPVSCAGWFNGCSNMTAFEGAERLDTSAVTSMLYMFNDCSKMVTPPAVGSWDTSMVTAMGSMFSNCAKMTTSPAVGSWDTSKVISAASMFSSCSKMTTSPAVSSWNTSDMTYMNYMFAYCSKMSSLDVSGWDFSKVTNSSYYLGLQNCSALREIKVPVGAKLAGLPEPSAQGVYFATWGNSERGITGSTAANLMSTVNAGNGAGTWKWELKGTAYAVLDSYGTLTLFRSTNTYSAGTGKTVTDIMGNTYTGQVFTGIEINTGTSSNSAPWWSKRTSVKLAKIADGQVIAPKSCAYWFFSSSNMTAFEGAERLDTSAVTNMGSMFQGCSKMTEPPAVGSWNTSAVTKMSDMFGSCSKMMEPPSAGNWNTSAVTAMSRMFAGCSKMASLDVSSWDFSNVTSSSNYLGLQNCSALKELKVPATAKLAGLPEHSTQGDYGTTWGNADRGITGSTAANLMSVVNAGNGAGTWTWEQAAAEYTVNFMVDGSGTAMQVAQVKADEDYVVPSCEVTKLYHDFVGWSGSDGNTYQAGDTVPAGTFAAGETLTLTAVFAPHEYGPGEIEGNLQLSVPASINFVVEPDGTLTGPSNASIVNNSGVSTHVSSVEVKELGDFNFVADAEASDEQNAVELRFGPLSDMLDAASFLSKSGVDDQSVWSMGTAAGQNTVQLETEGKVAHVGTDITKTNKFGEIRWYLKAGV